MLPLRCNVPTGPARACRLGVLAPHAPPRLAGPVVASPGGALVTQSTEVDVLTGEILPPRTDLLTAAPVTEVVALQQQYRELCTGLLDAREDFQRIGSSDFKKKSAWRKLAVAFNVSTEVLDERETRDEAGRIVRARYHVRATAPNGRHWDGIGVCDVRERCCLPGCSKGGSHRHCPAALENLCLGFTHFSNAEHDVPATAHTRASNRACADLFGLGEVSAEEVSDRAPTGAGSGARPPQAQRAGRGSGRQAPDVSRHTSAPPSTPTATTGNVEGTEELTQRLGKLSPADRRAYMAAIRARGVSMPPTSPEALRLMVSELEAIEQQAADEADTYGGPGHTAEDVAPPRPPPYEPPVGSPID